MKASIDISMPEFKKVSLQAKAETARDVLPRIERKEPVISTARDLKPSLTEINTPAQPNMCNVSASNNNKTRGNIKMGSARD